MQIMQSIGLRWTRLCVASSATAVFASLAPSAFATQKHALQPGETLDALARRYHVSVPDLIRANNIENQDNIPDGRVLTIPNPPRSLHVEATQHRAARVAKDSVSVRLGPGLEYRRANFAYEGDAVVVTAERDGWVQIKSDSGVKGWMLKSLLHGVGGSVEGQQTASRNREPEPKHSRKPAHHAAMIAAEEDRSRARKVARLQSGTTSAHHKRHAQHQEPVKTHESREEREAVVHNTKTRHKHDLQVARIAHETTKARRHHHDTGSEVAVSSHKRGVKRQVHAEETHVVKARHHAAVEQIAKARHHANAEHLARVQKKQQEHEAQVARVTHRKRHHAEEGGAQVAHIRRSHHSEVAQADAPQASSDIVRTAYAYRGTPYVWGGERPGGFDCSGFTMHLMGKKGVSLPHSARAQFGMGHKVDRNGMKPGDLVFFHTVTPGISHVGMYVGNGKFVHASSRRSGGVRVDSLEGGYYSKAFRGARRMRKSDD